MNSRRTAWLIFQLLVFVSPTWAKDDFQYRSLMTLKMVDTQKIDFVLFGQGRLIHDAKDVGFYSLSSQLKFDLWKNLSLGFNYTYLNVKVNNPVAGRSEFKFHHRVELEANPHWVIRDRLKVNMRNRYEFRWIEDGGSDNSRLRHRTNLEWPIKNRGPVQSIYANSEFFYDLHDHRYNENWTTPLGVKFRINDKTSLSFFYLLQSKRGADDWSSVQTFGTHFYREF